MNLRRASIGLFFLACLGCRDRRLDHARQFLELEDWDRAILLYDQAVQDDPSSAEARLGLGLSRKGVSLERAQVGLDSVAEWLEVDRDFAIVQRLDSTQHTASDRAEARYQMALCWQRLGNIPRAEQQAEQAQHLDPHHAPSASFLGNLARSHGEYLIAERWFSRALAADSSNMTAWASLGEIALLQDDPEVAAIYWEDALKRDPDHPWFLQKLQHLRDSLGWVGSGVKAGKP